MQTLRRWLLRIATAIVGLVLLFEEWGWAPLAAAMGRLARLPLWAAVERAIAQLPPWAALCVFTLPMIALLPVKLLAVWLIGSGHAATGFAVLIGAKLLGTAVFARLFTIVEPTLMRLAWFARWWPSWIGWKNAVIARVRASPGWTAWTRQRRVFRAAWRRQRARWGFGRRRMR